MSNTYDYSKLLGKIRERRITQRELASAIGISETSLNLSLNCKRPFKQSEISGICELLSIPLANVDAYFFCKHTIEI